jgi:hypothetical protein
MRAHFTTKERVGGRGPTRRTIVPRGILALSFAVVLLAATASTASAERYLSPWYCPPPPSTPPATSIEQVPAGCLDQFGAGPSFDFGDRQVGTTSPAQGFALAVFCLPGRCQSETFNPRISVSGDYAQTNNCPPTLSAGAYPQLQGCLITVTFAPTGTGPKNGTLSTGTGGPTVALTGNGVTTPTPPALPLLLSVEEARGSIDAKPGQVVLEKKLTLFHATTNDDSTLVARGGKIKKTTKQLKALEGTTIKAKVKHLKRLKEKPTRPEAKVNVKVTDDFGQTATEEIKVTLCRKQFSHGGPCWRPR